MTFRLDLLFDFVVFIQIFSLIFAIWITNEMEPWDIFFSYILAHEWYMASWVYHSLSQNLSMTILFMNEILMFLNYRKTTRLESSLVIIPHV